MKLQVAYILKMYPRFSETFIVNEILELERLGVDVRIYSLRKPDDGRFHAQLARVKANVIYAPQYPEMEPDRICEAHHRLRQAAPNAYQRVYDETRARGHQFALKRFLQAGYIAEHLQRHPVHAVHAHFATSAARVANLVYQLIGVPYSVTAHAKDIFHESVRPDSLRKKLGEARFVVTVSHFNQTHLRQLMGDQPADIRCLYNGVDQRRFRPGRAPRREDLILGVGRLVEKKGFEMLIDACAILRDEGVPFHCQIIGKGEREAALRAQISALGLGRRVRLIGPRSQDDVRRAYRRAAVFALPCVVARDGNRDGLPTVMLEAMSSGLPVVATPLTGVPEIVEDGRTGLLVSPGDAPALARALARLLASKPLRREMGDLGRQKAAAAFDVLLNVARLAAWLAEPAPSAWSEQAAPAAGAEVTGPQLPVPLSLEEVFAAL